MIVEIAVKVDCGKKYCGNCTFAHHYFSSCTAYRNELEEFLSLEQIFDKKGKRQFLRLPICLASEVKEQGK